MKAECLPISDLPGVSRLYRDFAEMRLHPESAGHGDALRRFYPPDPFAVASHSDAALRGPVRRMAADAGAVSNLLAEQNRAWGATDATLGNIERLRSGARAVVTGQQVGLFGGPALTLMKAATAIRRAQIATERGVPTVPIFWMATEDHDLPEVNQTVFPGKSGPVTLRSSFPHHAAHPVGGLLLGKQIEPILEQAEELLAYAPVTELLRSAYTAQNTLASAFAKLLTGIFGEHGLIVMDASTPGFHALGAPVLRTALEDADVLHEALNARSSELERLGYHAQVLVAQNASLLFLLDDSRNRVPLRRVAGADGSREWKAGSRTFRTADLLSILDAEPERLSPNALLRPVFQDALLPTTAYVGGPAEIAYFAQSEPLFQYILGAVTPVLPRLSATLIPSAIADVMDQHEVTLRDVLATGHAGADGLAQRLAARAMPIEGKRKIASAGNALDEELKDVVGWMESMSPNLGHSANIAANKMRYQMNRLRRLAANWQLERETHLRKHADAIVGTLFPDGHPQERLLSTAWAMSATSASLASLLISAATDPCPGHRVLIV